MAAPNAAAARTLFACLAAWILVSGVLTARISNGTLAGPGGGGGGPGGGGQPSNGGDGNGGNGGHDGGGGSHGGGGSSDDGSSNAILVEDVLIDLHEDVADAQASLSKLLSSMPLQVVNSTRLKITESISLVSTLETLQSQSTDKVNILKSVQNILKSANVVLAELLSLNQTSYQLAAVMNSVQLLQQDAEAETPPPPATAK